MTNLIFIIIALFEIMLAAYCVKTKSNQLLLKAKIRLAFMGLFLLLVVTAVIKWSFRWYLISIYLILQAIYSLITLVKKNNIKRKYKLSKTIIKPVLIIFIVFIALVPAFVFPQYKEPNVTGTYEVEYNYFTYENTEAKEYFNNGLNNRKVNVVIYYPKNSDKKKFPLVVFSHGAFGVKESNTSTFNELASNGYVVCSIDHSYHSMFTKTTDGEVILVNKEFIQEVLDVNNGVYSEGEGFNLTHKWLNLRKLDINFVIDTIVNSNSSNKAYRSIDKNKIALIGHSLGGAASVQLGRERDDIRAVINLDGSLIGEELSYTDNKYIINDEPYPIPMFSIYTDTMIEVMEKADYSNATLPIDYLYINSREAFHKHYKGTNHFSLTDLPLFSPLMVNLINGSIEKASNNKSADKLEIINKLNSDVLKFFNYYLKNIGEFNALNTKSR